MLKKKNEFTNQMLLLLLLFLTFANNIAMLTNQFLSILFEWLLGYFVFYLSFVSYAYFGWNLIKTYHCVLPKYSEAGGGYRWPRHVHCWTKVTERLELLLDLSSEVKFRYYEKATKFEKISHLFWQNSCFYSVASKQVGDIFKFLWPFQKSWTLPSISIGWY